MPSWQSSQSEKNCVHLCEVLANKFPDEFPGTYALGCLGRLWQPVTPFQERLIIVQHPRWIGRPTGTRPSEAVSLLVYRVADGCIQNDEKRSL